MLEVSNISKDIGPLKILSRVCFALKSGESVALMGPSGAGKTSLLQICALLDRPTTGEVIINQQCASSLTDKKRTHMRLNKIGFVYQAHHLLSDFNAIENVCLPMFIRGLSKHEAHTHAAHLLDAVGLAKRLSHKPHELSGGEKQRVAIARALANSPHILLADEPTGNLDSQTAQLVFDILLQETRKRNMTTLIATHNKQLATHMDRIIVIQDGII